MEQKTKVNAEDGKQEIVISREFDLPVELLFKAYEEPEQRKSTRKLFAPERTQLERLG